MKQLEGIKGVSYDADEDEVQYCTNSDEEEAEDLQVEINVLKAKNHVLQLLVDQRDLQLKQKTIELELLQIKFAMAGNLEPKRKQPRLDDCHDCHSADDCHSLDVSPDCHSAEEQQEAWKHWKPPPFEEVKPFLKARNPQRDIV